MRMHNPPHPGEVLYELQMEPAGISIKMLAERIGVDRKTVSRFVNGHRPVSVDMALRLARAFDTTPDLWLGMQQEYDLWHAEQEEEDNLSFIEPFPRERPKRRSIPLTGESHGNV